MNILVTNDDGVESSGIRTLAKHLKKLGNVWVVAPERPQNAMGRAITLHKPLRLKQLGRQVFSCERHAVGLRHRGHGPGSL